MIVIVVRYQRRQLDMRVLNMTPHISGPVWHCVDANCWHHVVYFRNQTISGNNKYFIYIYSCDERCTKSVNLMSVRECDNMIRTTAVLWQAAFEGVLNKKFSKCRPLVGSCFTRWQLQFPAQTVHWPLWLLWHVWRWTRCCCVKRGPHCFVLLRARFKNNELLYSHGNSRGL